MLFRSADSFWVQAVFDIADLPKIKELLISSDLEVEDELYLRRIINIAGKSKATINGVQVPLNVLKKISEALVDVHGQHENQMLLKIDFPLNLVDLYGKSETLNTLEKYKKLYKEYVTTKNKLKEFDKIDAEKARLIDLLEWEIKEIDDASLIEGELEELQAESKKIQNSGKILQAVNAAYQGLATDQGALDAVATAKSALTNVIKYDENLKNITESLDNVWFILDEAREELSDYLDKQEYDEERADYIQKRLDLWYRLQKKYGDSYEAINLYFEKSKNQLKEINDIVATIERTTKQLQEQTTKLNKIADSLTNLRSQYAKKLATAITNQIKDLSMPNGIFQIEINQKNNFDETGKDELIFLFSANLGCRGGAFIACA